MEERESKAMEMIKIEGVTKKFGELVAVDNLTLSVSEGEIFGFLGPNGAGKTTTIKMIVGLLRPNSGNILIGGIDIRKEPEKAKSIIGYIPDNPYIYDRLTGREFLYLTAGLHNLAGDNVRRKIDQLFELFNIGEWGDGYAGGYSHGMRQKIVMASALLHNPKVLVIDEPMVGLDPQSQRLVKDIFLLLARRGVSILMSTHTLAVAEEICTRIGIIHKGRLLVVGTNEELTESARSKSMTLEDYFLHLTGERHAAFLPE